MSSRQQRFLAKLDRSGGPDACWRLVHKDGTPYLRRATVTVGGRVKKAAVYSYELHNGAVPAGLDVSHTCGNGHLSCCNPAHLVAETRAANMARTVDHGTSNRGARNGSAVLDEARALAIYLDPRRPYRVIAKDFGVSATAVRLIKNGQRWRWLTQHHGQAA